jgi:hypothetical protein
VALWKMLNMARDTSRQVAADGVWMSKVILNSFDKKMVEKKIAGIFLNLNRGRYARTSKYMVGTYAWRRGV